VADEDLSQVLRDAIRDMANRPDDDERDWLRRATRRERRVVGDFGALEHDLEGPSEAGTAIEREGIRAGSPKITKVDPDDFEPGSLVTLHGKNLFDVQQVLFDDKPAKQMVIVSNQRIEAVVPDDAESSAITIVLRPTRKERERQRQAAEAAHHAAEEEEEQGTDETIVVFSYADGDETDEIDE
jgi:hypothetical protein